MPQFEHYIGIDYSGAKTPTSSLPGLRVYAGDWLLGALRPHGVLSGLERPAFLAMYYDLLGTLIRRQLMVGQSAIVDCLLNEEIAVRTAAMMTGSCIVTIIRLFSAR